MRKQLISLFLLLTLMATVQGAKADISPTTLPELNAVKTDAAGQWGINGVVSRDGNQLNVITGNENGSGAQGQVSQFDWKSFDVGKDATVNWGFTNHYQTSINRVIGNNMSQIYGHLINSSCGGTNCGYEATSKVILINPNGLMFANGSTVDLNSFTVSTHDINGIKNTAGMSEDYANEINNKYTYNKTITFQGTSDKAVELDHSKWNVDKSAAILAKDIELKGSAIRTTLGYNGKIFDDNGETVDGSFSAVHLVTSNGADFYYANNGYLDAAKTHNPTANSNTKYNIDIQDSEISSGLVAIRDKGMTYGSDINIKNSTIKGTKLMMDERGDIVIVANSKVNVNNSNILTENGSQAGTKAKTTGGISITGGLGVDVVNGSKIKTAETTATKNLENPVVLDSPYGNVNVKNSDINSGGKLAVYADNTLFENSNLNYDKSAFHVDNQVNNVTFKGATTVTDRSNADKLVLETNGNLTLDNATLRKYQSTTNNQKAIDLVSSKDVNVINASDVTATTGAITANAAKNVNVINSKLTAKTSNNLTAAAAANIECSDLIADVNNEVVANNKVTVKNSELTAKADNKLTSKTSDMEILNSRIKADKNNTFTASKGAFTAKNVEVTAKGNNKIEALNDVVFAYDKDLNCKDGSCLKNIQVDTASITGATNDIISNSGDINLIRVTVKATDGVNNIKAHDNINTDCAIVDGTDNKLEGTNGKVNTKHSSIIATNNNTVKAGKDITTLSTEYKAGNSNSLTANNNIETVHTLYEATKGNNSLIATNGKITAKNVQVEAKEKKNVIKAKGNIEFGYTDAVKCEGGTCTNLNFPEDKVSAPEGTEITSEEGSIKTTDDLELVYRPLNANRDNDEKGEFKGNTGKALDTDGTKLKVNAKGEVSLALKNAGNKNAGLEVEAGIIKVKTTDHKLAISKLVADDLYLSREDEFIAGNMNLPEDAIANVQGTFAPTNPLEYQNAEGANAGLSGRAYIKVNHGFNFDYAPNPVAVEDVYQASFNEVPEGYDHHFVDLNAQNANSTANGKFVLSYTKPYVEAPAPLPVTPNSPEDELAKVTIPLQADILGKPDGIQNNITDPTSGLVAAAASITLDEEEEQEEEEY